MLKLIHAEWEVSKKVHALVTTRHQGFSKSPFDSLNLGDHVNDDPSVVTRNRAYVQQILNLPNPPCWLQQTHGNQVITADTNKPLVSADACVSRQPGAVCAVLTADCLPIFFAAINGSEVGVAHAGWRGLAGGVIEATLDAMNAPNQKIAAWMGPAIGPNAFEVREELREIFIALDARNAHAFKRNKPGHYLADIYQLAAVRLTQAGVATISGGKYCTYTGAADFYSYRREGETGRMASLIWIA